MIHLTREITREYRLDFNTGEAHWDADASGTRLAEVGV